MNKDQYHGYKKIFMGQGMNDKASMRMVANSMGMMGTPLMVMGVILVIVGIPLIALMGAGIFLIISGLVAFFFGRKQKKKKISFLEMIEADEDLPERV